jgi:hypothetical protein
MTVNYFLMNHLYVSITINNIFKSVKSTFEISFNTSKYSIIILIIRIPEESKSNSSNYSSTNANEQKHSRTIPYWIK